MRADLRVHTKHSDKPTNFFLRSLKAPESLTEPVAAYALAKRRGMDFVTFTDSDTITGCLELSDYPDVFTACKTTVAFPDDDCKIQLLIYDLNETQLRQLLAYRGHIFNVRDFLLAENLFHAVAAPLEILNNRLSPDHLEKMIVLFDHFETHCGSRSKRTYDFLSFLLNHLTPELLNHVSRKWSIEPASERPWEKGVIGGSNDFCEQYIGLTWTHVSESCNTPKEFIAALRQKNATTGGEFGATIASAHSFYRVAAAYYQKNVKKRSAHESDFVSLILDRVLSPGTPPLSLATRWQVFRQSIMRVLRTGKRPSAIERRLLREFALAYAQIPKHERLSGIHPNHLNEFDERLYALADRVIGQVTYRLFSYATREFTQGRIGNAIAFGATILPIQSVLAPYIYAYKKLNRDRKLIVQTEERFKTYIDFPAKSPRKKIAWFSDTITDVNGVSLTLHKMAEAAEQNGEDLVIVSSVVAERAPVGPKFKNFEPIGEIPIPDYPLQKISMPPALKILRYLEAEGFTEYIISTPGPVGLTALFAAKTFGVPCRAIYHSDFPQHVRHITGDESLEQLTWTAMRAFYFQADAIYSPSAFYRDQLAEHSFPREKMFIFQRGTDLESFNPRHRDEKFFETWNLSDKCVFIYTGRISKEKNLDIICQAFMADPLLQERAALVLIGDGPYRDTMAARYNHPSIIFPGFMKGKSLARAYASADVFVFPSTTDTYGNSVLEAQASGLPALVTDEGGPKEIIVPDKTGFVLSGHDIEMWRTTMRKFVEKPEWRLQMAAAARAHTATRDWNTAFREFWDENPYSDVHSNKQTVIQANTQASR